MEIIITVNKPDGTKVEYVKDASLVTLEEMGILFNSLADEGAEMNIKEYR